MELVRVEEIEAAAAEVNGSHGDLEILDAAAELSAQQERYRLESLAQQGSPVHRTSAAAGKRQVQTPLPGPFSPMPAAAASATGN